MICKIQWGREPLNPRAYEATPEYQYNDIFAYEEIRKTTTVLVPSAYTRKSGRLQLYWFRLHTDCGLWRTVDATEQTRFSRSRPNDLEHIGQGQRSLHATHPLMLMMICAKYGKYPSRTVEFFFQGQGRKISKICLKFNFSDYAKNVTHDTPSNDSDHLC